MEDQLYNLLDYNIPYQFELSDEEEVPVHKHVMYKGIILDESNTSSGAYEYQHNYKDSIVSRKKLSSRYDPFPTTSYNYQHNLLLPEQSSSATYTYRVATNQSGGSVAPNMVKRIVEFCKSRHGERCSMRDIEKACSINLARLDYHVVLQECADHPSINYDPVGPYLFWNSPAHDSTSRRYQTKHRSNRNHVVPARSALNNPCFLRTPIERRPRERLYWKRKKKYKLNPSMTEFDVDVNNQLHYESNLGFVNSQRRHCDNIERKGRRIKANRKSFHGQKNVHLGRCSQITKVGQRVRGFYKKTNNWLQGVVHHLKPLIIQIDGFAQFVDRSQFDILEGLPEIDIGVARGLEYESASYKFMHLTNRGVSRPTSTDPATKSTAPAKSEQ